jgi:hypothetical protein
MVNVHSELGYIFERCLCDAVLICAVFLCFPFPREIWGFAEINLPPIR